MVSTVRVPLGTIIVLTLGQLLVAQTSDVLASAADGARLQPALWVAVAALAISAWYWSRAALAARFPEMELPQLRTNGQGRAEVDEVAWRWLPRLVFLAAFVPPLLAALNSGAWLQAILLLLLSGLLLGALVLRRRLFGPREDLAPQLHAEAGWAFRWEIPLRLRQLLRLAPGGAGLAGLWLGLGLLMLLGSLLAIFGLSTEAVRGVVPAWPGLAAVLGACFPGPGALYVAVAFALAVATALSFVADGLRVPARWHGVVRRPPVFLLLALVAVLVAAMVPLHAVRIVAPGHAAVAPAARRPLGELFDGWVAACAPGDAAQPVRPVIVALSGGASKAALWAARVLRDVEAALPPPGAGAPAIFAVSSVSGSSLGAGAWISTIAGEPDRARCRTDPTPAPDSPEGVSRADRALAGLGGDLLGAPLAGLLIDDIPRALIGWIPGLAGGAPARGGDRAEATERGIELLWQRASHAAWDDAAGRPLPLDRGFLALFYATSGTPRSGVPLWIANATDSRSGRRVLTTPFASADPRQWPFRDSGDALALAGADLPASTVIVNSARVAFLFPPGELAPLHPAADLTSPRHDQPTTALVDGGYFDNGGLLSAVELAEWLRGPEGRKAAGGRPVEPILIEANADADRAVGGEGVVRCGPLPADDPAAASPHRLRLGLLASPIGPDMTRGGLARTLERRVRDTFCPHEGQPAQGWFQFYLHAPPEADVPINWALSDAAATWIWQRAMHTCDNAAEMARLRAAGAAQ
jgi:hypothetical protein